MYNNTTYSLSTSNVFHEIFFVSKTWMLLTCPSSSEYGTVGSFNSFKPVADHSTGTIPTQLFWVLITS